MSCHGSDARRGIRKMTHIFWDKFFFFTGPGLRPQTEGPKGGSRENKREEKFILGFSTTQEITPVCKTETAKGFKEVYD